MATIHTTDEQLQLFTGDDPYFYTTDNRPLRKLQANIVAMNDQLEDIVESDCELASFVVEVPTGEAGVGGVYVVREAGEIIRVVLSRGTQGSADSDLVDVNVNGTTIFTNQGNRPTLPWNEAVPVNERLTAEIQQPDVVAGDRLTVDFDTIQTGGRWARVDVWIRKAQAPYTAA